MSVDDLRKIGLEHGRQLFIYHAGQRVQSIGHYFAVLAFLTTAAVTLLTTTSHFPLQKEAGMGLCVVALIITLLLWGIDSRNAHLVRLDENLIKAIEEGYEIDASDGAGSSKIPCKLVSSFKIMNNAEDYAFQYKWLVPLLFLTFIGIWGSLLWIFRITEFGQAPPLTVEVTGSLQGQQLKMGQEKKVSPGVGETSNLGTKQTGPPKK